MTSSVVNVNVFSTLVYTQRYKKSFNKKREPFEFSFFIVIFIIFYALNFNPPKSTFVKPSPEKSTPDKSNT